MQQVTCEESGLYSSRGPATSSPGENRRSSKIPVSPLPKERRFRFTVVLLAAAVLAGLALWRVTESPVTRERRPAAIMGTESLLRAVGTRRAVKEGLAAAEVALRRVEALMSTWLEVSELARFNRAGANEDVDLSQETLTVLGEARRLHGATGGAFDVTCRPLIELWREAGRTRRLPDDEEVGAARAASRWAMIELGARTARKRTASARIDLGGIAKGYGIDRAVEALRSLGCDAGLVEVGGDLRAFGDAPGDGIWDLGIRGPAGEGILGRLGVRDAAVCTSGPYHRQVVIAGRRYSHIVDPRTGRPADRTSSVTVVASTALLADAWATALSVTGHPGLRRLPEIGVDALVVEPVGGGLALYASPGLGRLWTETPPLPITIVGPE